MSSFLDRPVAMAALAAGFLRFLGFLFPVVTTPIYAGHLVQFDFTITLAQPLAALVVLLVTAVNYLSIKFSGNIQVILTSLKMATILMIVVGGVLFGEKNMPVAVPLVNHLVANTSLLATIGAVLSALVPAMWAYNGFNDLGDLGEEILEPQKNIPRAVILGLCTIAGLYLLANVIYFYTLPFSSIAASQHIASDVVRSFAGTRGAAALTIAMAISALGALHVVVLTGARIPYAMARDGLFFEFAGKFIPAYAPLAVRSTFSGLHLCLARAQRHLRTALLALCFCSLDLLRIDSDRSDSSPPQTAGSFTPISRVGLSHNSDHLFHCSRRSYGQLVDGSAGAFIFRPVGNSRRSSLLLPLA